MTDKQNSKIINKPNKKFKTKNILIHLASILATLLFIFGLLFSNYIYILTESEYVNDAIEDKKSSETVKYEYIDEIYSKGQLKELKELVGHTNNKFINVYEYTNKIVIKYYGNVWYTVDVTDSANYYMTPYMSKVIQELTFIITTIVVSMVMLFVLIKLRKSVVNEPNKFNIKIKYPLIIVFLYFAYFPIKVNELLGYISASSSIFIAMGLYILLYYSYIFGKHYNLNMTTLKKDNKK